MLAMIGILGSTALVVVASFIVGGPQLAFLAWTICVFVYVLAVFVVGEFKK
jgi:hypothetical protein